MNKDKDYRGWSWIAWYLIATLVGVVLLSSCRTKKQTQSVVDTKTEQSSIITSNTTSLNNEHESWWLAFMADSISWSFSADSIKTSQGDILYNPKSETKVNKPKIQESATNENEQTHSASVEAVNESKSSSLEQEQTTSENIPINPYPPVATLIILGVVGFSLWRWWKNK